MKKTDDREHFRHTYYITAIPTIFEGIFSDTESFQYTASEYSHKGQETAIVFRTEINPTSIHYFMESNGVLGLVMQLFSIIGGIFMIAKLFDACLTSAFIKERGYSEVDPGTELS